jgi:hypothetical protein
VARVVAQLLAQGVDTRASDGGEHDVAALEAFAGERGERRDEVVRGPVDEALVDERFHGHGRCSTASRVITWSTPSTGSVEGSPPLSPDRGEALHVGAPA